MTDQQTLERFLSVFAQPPVVKVDEPTGALVGPFTVTKTVNQVKGIGGRLYEVPSYTLDVDPGDGNPFDLASGSILAVGIALAEQYAGYLARTVEDALAADYAAEKQALADAFQEGYRYYQQTAPGQRTNEAYPYGIQHYREWLKGYAQADDETVF